MQQEKPNNQIENSFFDLIIIFWNFFLSSFNSISMFFWNKKNIKNNSFFDILDFIFKIWPKYFWKNPTGYKLTTFFWDTIKYIFFRK